MKRSSGVLMHISSLPSPHGIGTLGRAAYDFVDFLEKSGQSLWQMLPVGPTGCGDSPYQSFSAFAGNPYFIDLDMLAEEGFLTREEVLSFDWGSDPSRTDYGKLYAGRLAVLEKAAARLRLSDGESVEKFSALNASWLLDYALFMALKRHFGMRPWNEWDDEAIRRCEPSAVERYRALLREDVWLFTCIQYLFFKQWEALHGYALRKNVRLIGDMPIYVSYDSADVWAQPKEFLLDAENVPTAVAGVPPDAFSKTGQLWGNPLYDWEKMKVDGYGWWIRRMDAAGRMFDIVRIDHFRGFESFWSVPYGDKTAENGRWEKGPGLELIRAITGWFPNLRLIAEDLGVITPEVRTLLKESGIPGMKVLQFAFEPGEASEYLPHMHERACVCYVGTHDNETLAQWAKNSTPKRLQYVAEYLGAGGDNAAKALLRAGMASVADVFIVTMQDLLGLGAEGRMNTPGKTDGNWTWRMSAGADTNAIAADLRRMSVLYGRAKPVKRQLCVRVKR